MKRMNLLKTIAASVALLITASAHAGKAPNMYALSQGGYVMSPTNAQYPVHNSWVEPNRVMENLTFYDTLVRRIQNTICGTDQKKSVLLIGEPSQAFRYFFARLASHIEEQKCQGMYHVEINTNKITAGHKYVGEVQEYWNSYVLEPSESADVVLYFPQLSALLGAGSHSNDKDGIERDYAQNISSGVMRSVAFMDKYQYNTYANSEYAYVIEAFKDRIVLPPMTASDLDQFVNAYLTTLYPNFVLGKTEANTLYRLSEYYNPNRSEPDRTLSNLSEMIRLASLKHGDSVSKYTFTQEDIRTAVMSVAQVPGWMINRDYSIIRELGPKLEADVVGVGEARNDIVRLAKIGYISGHTDEKPVGSILLAGPTGTGKSYVAKKMADFTGLKLITLDMTAYKDSSSVLEFTRIMTRHLTNNPYAVILFEEIDKASTEALDQLYFLLDEGIFYDEFQRPLFARGAFIMMTTNAGAEVIIENPDAPDLRAKFMKALSLKFRDSFLNRFGAISMFKPFTDVEFARLSSILVSKKIAKLDEIFGWKMTTDQATLDFIAVNGRSKAFGARPMERLVENVISYGIAEYNLEVGTINTGDNIKMTKAAGINDFMISVNGGKAVPFTVTVESNSLYSNFMAHKLTPAVKKLREAFARDRMY